MTQSDQSPETTFRSNLHSSPLPPCSIDMSTLRRIFETLNQFAQEAAKHEVTSKVQGDLTDEQFADLKKSILNGYRLNIQILASSGEYFASTSVDILEKNHIPRQLQNVTFDSSVFYKWTFQSNPMNSIRLILDFTKPDLFDFATNPSQATTNNSLIEVIGQSESWATGVHEKTLKTLKEMSLRRKWLHSRGAYDVVLWFLVIPLAFWNLHKLTQPGTSFLSSLSGPLSVFAYIYFFFIALFLYRAFFNYARWLFPFIEFRGPVPSVSTKQRMFFIFVATTLLIGLLQDFARTMITILF